MTVIEIDQKIRRFTNRIQTGLLLHCLDIVLRLQLQILSLLIYIQVHTDIIE